MSADGYLIRLYELGQRRECGSGAVPSVATVFLYRNQAGLAVKARSLVFF